MLLESSVPLRPKHDRFSEARKQWADQQYSILDDLLPRELCLSLARDILAAHTQAVRSGQKLPSRHLNCFPGSGAQALAVHLERVGISDLVSELAGTQMKLTAIDGNCNLPGSHYQHFHTDTGWNNQFTIVNVMLIDTDFENGATELIPNSYKRPIPYWKFVMTRMYRRGVRHRTKAGAIIIRDSRLWHRGTPNRSDKMRPMLVLAYFPSSESPPPIDYNKYDGRITFKLNQFSSSLSGRMWEMISDHAPWAFAAYWALKSLTRSPLRRQG